MIVNMNAPAGGVVALLTCALLSGCGLAGTAASTAVGGASEAEQAREAKQIEAQAQLRLQQAQQADADRRDAAEKDAR
jgi:hypothetical protein